MKIVSIIDTLLHGGAESVMTNLISGMPQHEHVLVHFSRSCSTKPSKYIIKRLKEIGVSVKDIDFHALEKKELQSKLSKNPFALPLILYTGVILFSLSYSINFRSSLYYLYSLVPLLCVYITVSHLEEKYHPLLIKLILIPAVLLSIYGIYQFTWGFEFTKDFMSGYTKEFLKSSYAEEILVTKRAIGTFFSPNIFASYLAIIIPLCAGVLFESFAKKGRASLFYAISLAAMLLALLITKSMSGCLSVALGAVLFILFLKRRYLSPKIILISCLAIITIPVFILFLRHETFIDFSNQQNSIVQRLHFWKASLGIIKDFPFQGIGAGNFGNIYAKYKTSMGNETIFAHNILLQTWAELGLAGLLAILWVTITFIMFSLKIKKDPITLGLVISCYVFIINNLFTFSYFVPQVSFFWWLLLGLAVSKAKGPKATSRYRFTPFLIVITLLFILLNLRHAIGLVYFQKGNYPYAIKMEPYNDLYYATSGNYKKAIELNPYFPFYHRDLALEYLNLRMSPEAIFEFEKARELYPASVFLHKALIELYTKTGETKKAQEETEKLRELSIKRSGYSVR